MMTFRLRPVRFSLLRRILRTLICALDLLGPIFSRSWVLWSHPTEYKTNQKKRPSSNSQANTNSTVFRKKFGARKNRLINPRAKPQTFEFFGGIPLNWLTFEDVGSWWSEEEDLLVLHCVSQCRTYKWDILCLLLLEFAPTGSADFFLCGMLTRSCYSSCESSSFTLWA